MELFANILEIGIFSSIMILIVLSIKAIFGNKINAKNNIVSVGIGANKIDITDNA